MDPVFGPGLDQILAPAFGAFEGYLDETVPSEDPFAEALRYPLFPGGKRIRPLLCLASWEAVRTDDRLERVVPMAVAVELVHTYSLVHDDLPCMDDDDERRGHPTVHSKYGDAAAVLVGDALLTLAFGVLASSPASGTIAAMILSDAAGHLGMIGGQFLDMGLGGRVDSVARLTELHELKTGRLIRAACHLGGLAAGATKREIGSLIRYGDLVGLAFQLVDDILDAREDAGEEGPPSFVKLLGIDETRRRAEAAAAEARERVSDFHRPAALIALANFTVNRTV